MYEQSMELFRRHERNCEYHRICGLHIISVAPGFAEVIMEPHKEILNPMGAIHGGAIFTLCDVAAGTAAMARGKAVVTQSASMNFLRKAGGDQRLTARATEVKRGHTSSIYQVSIFGENPEKPIAIATMTMYYTGDLQEALV